MKKYVIGFIVGAMLMLSTNAFAAIGDSVTAVFAEFNYVLNGETKTLDSPVLVYDGNSYLRTTQVSNLLGYDVTYKADTRTIEFTGTLPPAPEPIPTVAPEPTPVPSGEPTPTPAPSGEPVPTGSVTPSPDSAVTPTPTPSLEPTPTPTPDNTASCQRIRDDYNGQIAALSYQGLTQGNYNLKEYQLGYYRDQALAAAGCQ